MVLKSYSPFFALGRERSANAIIFSASHIIFLKEIYCYLENIGHKTVKLLILLNCLLRGNV